MFYIEAPARGWAITRNQGDRLIGFRSFGPDGQAPGWQYDDSALDTGGGLRPMNSTGQGLGRSAISAGLAFGRERFAPAAFRVTVASFAHPGTTHSGGSRLSGAVDSFAAVRDARPFDVLIRAEGLLSRSSAQAEGPPQRNPNRRPPWRFSVGIELPVDPLDDITLSVPHAAAELGERGPRPW